MILTDLFENARHPAYRNLSALQQAVKNNQDAVLNFGGDDVTVDYHLARYIAGRYAAQQTAADRAAFLATFADARRFDALASEYRAMADQARLEEENRDSGWKPAAPHRDQFGNPVKHVARHLARQGMKQAEKEKSKQPEKAAESKKKSEVDAEELFTYKGADPGLRLAQYHARRKNPRAVNDFSALMMAMMDIEKQNQSYIDQLKRDNDHQEQEIDQLERENAAQDRTDSFLKSRLQALANRQKSTTDESLRSDEWHDVTVTFDDGSTTTVKTTGDSGYRDQITQHFARQGKTVKDIEIDWSVKSVEEGEKKPKPTNPQLWGRAKAAAKSKFDVYPSAYANAWAAKWYKSKGGGWR